MTNLSIKWYFNTEFLPIKINISAHVTSVNKRTQSVNKYSNHSSTLHENEENGHVHVLIRKEALVELKNIINKANKEDAGFDIENISPNEMSTLCNILANCGIFGQETKR